MVQRIGFDVNMESGKEPIRGSQLSSFGLEHAHHGSGIVRGNPQT